MRHDNIVDEVMTLIVAGHETTASAFALTRYSIAMHPSVAARLQAEADTIDLAPLRRTRRIDRQTLAYTDRVAAETLRLDPPGWLLSRRANRVHRLGPVIRSGTQVLISLYLLHRHARYWREPARFDPVRFEREDEPSQRFAYLPYAAGSGHCIGEHRAATEMRVHLASMMRRFTPNWRKIGDLSTESAINLRPTNGIYLQ